MKVQEVVLFSPLIQDRKVYILGLMDYYSATHIDSYINLYRTHCAGE